MKSLIVLIAILFAAGCASGSALVTGQTRPAIEDYTTVTILTEMPEGAEQIAIVTASSNMGITQQKSLNYAAAELQQQAAMVGANAVVLTGRNTSTQLHVTGNSGQTGSPVASTSEKETVQGMAVWLD